MCSQLLTIFKINHKKRYQMNHHFISQTIFLSTMIIFMIHKKKNEKFVISKFFAKQNLIALIRKRNHNELNDDFNFTKKSINENFEKNDHE